MNTYNPFKIAHAVLAFIGRFLSSQWNQFNPLGQMLFALALAAIVIDAAVSFQYGLSMTKWHAAGFAVVAIAFCVLPDVAVTEARKKNWGGAASVAIASALLGLVALQSHIGYGGGIRMKEIQQTQFQHAKAADVRKLASLEETNLGMWRNQLATKQEDLAKLKKSNPWVAEVKPDGLVSELASVKDRMAKEEKGQRGRKAGQGKEFERLQDQANDIEKRLASVKAFNETSKEIAELTKQIAATQRVIDSKIETVANTGFDSNVVLNQTDIITSLVNFARGVEAEAAINPTSIQRTVANTAVVGFNSIGFLICGPILMVAAGFNRLRKFVFEDEEPARPTYTDVQPRTPTYSAPAPKGMHPDMAAIMGMLKGSNLNATSNTIGRAAGLA